MTFLNQIKPNEPTASLGGYLISFHGKSKFGKTTFAIKLIKEAYNGDLSKAVLLGCEIGYRAQKGVYAIPISDFKESDKQLDEDGNEIIDENTTYGFIETVDELIENKKDITFEFVVIDTITALEKYAKKDIIHARRIADGKPYRKIGDIPYGVGYEEVADAIYEQIDRLQKAGFGVMVIGHSKSKKIKNKSGFEYDYEDLNTLGKVTEVIERESDFLIYGDLQVVKKGVDGVKEERVLRLRSDGNVLCGTRFEEFPDTLPLDAKAFLEEFEKAVLGLYDGDEKAVEERKDKEEEHRKEVASNPEVTASSLIEQIDKKIKNLSKSDKIEVAKGFKEILGDANFKKSEDKKALAKALAFVSK